MRMALVLMAAVVPFSQPPQPGGAQSYHTTTTQLAEIANKTQPGLLIMHHRGIGPRGREISDEQYLSDVRRTYNGKVVVGNDLDIY